MSINSGTGAGRFNTVQTNNAEVQNDLTVGNDVNIGEDLTLGDDLTVNDTLFGNKIVSRTGNALGLNSLSNNRALLLPKFNQNGVIFARNQDEVGFGQNINQNSTTNTVNPEAVNTTARNGYQTSVRQEGCYVRRLPLTGGPVETIWGAGNTFSTAGAGVGSIIHYVPTNFNQNTNYAANTVIQFALEVNNKINLYSSTYNIGVQPATLFYRASVGAGHSFQAGGTFSPVANDPSGGTWLMNVNAVNGTRTLNCSPLVDDTQTLGTASLRWNEIFSTNATINTSDAREKNQSPLRVGLDFIKTLKPVEQSWKKTNDVVYDLSLQKVFDVDESGEELSSQKMEEIQVPRIVEREGKRKHFGLIAQDVKGSLGVSAMDYAVWGLQDKDDNDSRQYLRQTELIAPMIKAIQELSDKVVFLENRVRVLEGKH